MKSSSKNAGECFLWLIVVVSVTMVAAEEYFNNNNNQWCYTKTFQMTVRAKGCESRIITNKYCYGQCNSYYVPAGLNDVNRENEIPQMRCTVCAPEKIQQERIPLYCTRTNGKPKIKFRQVYFVEGCKCTVTPCSKLYAAGGNSKM